MNFSPSKEKGIRRIILIAIAVVTALIQHTPGFNLNLGSLSPMLLVPFVVCVAMYERSFTGLLVGALSGVLWDFASSGADGMFTLMLTTIAFAVGVLIAFYLRNRLITAVALSFVSCLAVSVAYWMVFILRKGYDGTWQSLFLHFLPLAAYSAAFVFIYYYLVGFIVKATEKTESTKRFYTR